MTGIKRRFSIDDKRRLLELYDQLPAMSQRKAAATLNVAPSLLWTCLHNRNTIMKGEVLPRKKAPPRCCKFPRLEAALWKWIDHCTLSGDPINDLMIHRRAVALAARMGLTRFRASPNWYSGFKTREAVVRERYRIYPEADPNHQPKPDTNGAGSVSPAPTPTSDPDSQCVQETPDEASTPSVILSDQEEIRTAPTVTSTDLEDDLQTITVPSVHQMKEAMNTLATGLLYRGFSDFKLLHQFKKEVENVVKRSVALGCKDSFIA
ncbi:uncharacterized protein LOC134335723 [Trichomycterus rosablanca]|uniref:uncharacterized protein LOC134335723 n=1 Tax=Trichomycterus rosablanca TaxID=2290929 RepID=UPI002F357C4E